MSNSAELAMLKQERGNWFQVPVTELYGKICYFGKFLSMYRHMRTKNCNCWFCFKYHLKGSNLEFEGDDGFSNISHDIESFFLFLYQMVP